MMSAAKVFQGWQSTPLGASRKRGETSRSMEVPFRSPKRTPWLLLLTRCSSIDSDNATSSSSSNPRGIDQLDASSATQVTPHPSLRRTLGPSKQSKGLVFGVGPASSWDAAEVGSPVVRRYIGDNEERWLMWYYGRDGASTDSIGLATSSNGVCWARGGEAAGSSGGVGEVVGPSSSWWAFDTWSVRPSDMVMMSSPMYSGVYWLYYTGYTDEEVDLPGVGKSYRSLPGLACSQDGRNWAKIEGDHHSGAVLDVGPPNQWDSLFISRPNVVVHSDNDLRMYYHSYDAAKGEFAVGLARSRDGIRWVKLGKVMGKGTRGAFDDLGVVNADVVRDAKEGGYLMAYEGVSACGKRRSVGVAVSDDGLGGWTRVGRESVLERAEDGAWDDVAVCSPCLVRMDDGWRLYYKGVGQGGSTGVGMAVSSATDVSRFRRWDGFHF